MKYYYLTWSEVSRFLLSNKSCQVAVAMTFPRKDFQIYIQLSDDSDSFRSYTVKILKLGSEVFVLV